MKIFQSKVIITSNELTYINFQSTLFNSIVVDFFVPSSSGKEFSLRVESSHILEVRRGVKFNDTNMSMSFSFCYPSQFIIYFHPIKFTINPVELLYFHPPPGYPWKSSYYAPLFRNHTATHQYFWTLSLHETNVAHNII